MINWEKGNGLLPAIIQDASNGQILMLGFLSPESWALTLENKEVYFFSRTRQRIWKKGESSGNVLKLKRWMIDCDTDSFLILVEPTGPTCHSGERSCFGPAAPAFENLQFLADVIDTRWDQGDLSSSYVAKLKAKGLAAMAQKVGEEATETVIASLAPKDSRDFIEESSDLFFHWLVLAKAQGFTFDDVIQNLKKRMSKA